MKKTLLLLFVTAAQFSLAAVTFDMRTVSPPISAGKSFAKTVQYADWNSSVLYNAKLTSTIKSVGEDSFEIVLSYSAKKTGSTSTFSFEFLKFIGEGCGISSPPAATVTRSLAKTSSQANGTETIKITGLVPDSVYWFECHLTVRNGGNPDSPSTTTTTQDTFWTCVKTSPQNLTIGTVAVTPSTTSVAFGVPVSKLGTGNESAQIDIVVMGQDGQTRSATETVTEAGTVSMTFDDPPLLAGANYTAVVTVTGSKTGSVTKNVSFTTLASAPTLGALSTNAVEDVSATLNIPVTAIGAGNTYVDVLVTADGADGSSATGEVQRVSADGGVAQVTLSGLTPYTEYTATAVATSSSGGTATQTLSFATRASDPQIGAVFVMSQQDTAGAFLVPVNSMGAGNTEVTITATAFGDDGTRAESSTVCTALGNNYATISGLSPGTPYDVTITVTGNHGGSATASTTLTTTGTRTTIVSVVVDGDTLPTRWLIDNGIIQNSLGLTEADLVELWGTTAANGMTLHECYVAGLDPGDPDADLVAYISMNEAAEPVITWAPDLTPDRIYTVIGRTNLTDSGWVDPTNESTHFYKVKASLP